MAGLAGWVSEKNQMPADITVIIMILNTGFCIARAIIPIYNISQNINNERY